MSEPATHPNLQQGDETGTDLRIQLDVEATECQRGTEDQLLQALITTVETTTGGEVRFVCSSVSDL